MRPWKVPKTGFTQVKNYDANVAKGEHLTSIIFTFIFFHYFVSRLESITYPLFSEPTHMVVYDIAFKRETYFDGSFGVLTKVGRE